MIVTNPTAVAIEMTLKGNVYRIPANGSINNVPADVADDWKTRTHEFIIVEDEKTASAPKVEKIESDVPPLNITKEDIESVVTPKKK